jgi:hypothetical protein
MVLNEDGSQLFVLLDNGTATIIEDPFDSKFLPSHAEDELKPNWNTSRTDLQKGINFMSSKRSKL